MAKSLLALGGLAAAAAQSTNWTILSTFPAFAVAADQVDAKTGYVAAGSNNGLGYEIWKTTDNWNTYEATPMNDPGMVLTDVAAFGHFVQVVGTLDFYYSNDAGATYKNSTFQYPGAADSVKTIGPNGNETGFGMVGGWVQALFSRDEGIAVSYNGGANYTITNLTLLDTAPRFGAFPSATTWFVNAGQFPGEGSDDNGPSSSTSQKPTTGLAASAGEYIVDRNHYTNVAQIPEGTTFIKAYGARAHLLRTPEGKLVFGTVKKEHTFNANVNRFGLGSGPNITTYWDQVVKTTDAGKTWSLVYNVFNKNYGNEIHCTSETHCCFPAESPGVAGAEIICTFDGNNFEVVYTNPDPFSSIMAISALSEDIWWAGGGELTQIGVANSQFYLSTDGGRTWAKAGPQWSEQYIEDIDCVPSLNTCWSTQLIQEKGSFSVATLVQ